MHMESKGTKTVNKSVPHGVFSQFCSAINITRLVLLMELCLTASSRAQGEEGIVCMTGIGLLIGLRGE